MLAICGEHWRYPHSFGDEIKYLGSENRQLLSCPPLRKIALDVDLQFV